MVSLSLASFSKLTATESNDLSRNPPVSPARIRLIISGGNTLGWRWNAAESAVPLSTSLRTWPRIFASTLFSVCSARIVSVRNRERPDEIMVAI